MARQITCSPEVIEKLLAKARTELMGKKYQSNKVNLSLSLEKDDRIAEVYFSPKAWLKMNRLVKEFSTEVQWHGTVKRISETQFFVEDILVFPHEVTATTVVSKQEEYEAWLDALDDETFNKLRFHGHSHVKMHVRPSGTDEDVQTNFLKGLGKPAKDYDPFYIFLIINKDGDINCQVYDITNNALYDDDEVFTDVYLDGTDFSKFIEDAKKLATEPVRAVGYGYHGGHGHQGKKKKEKNTAETEPDYDDMFFGYYGGGYRT